MKIKCNNLLCSLPDLWDSMVVAIGSNTTTLKLDEIVSSLLSKEMRQKHMEGQNGDAFYIQGQSHNKNKNNSSCGRSKSSGKSIKVCWKCGKERHFKNDCRSKSIEKGNGFDDAPSLHYAQTFDAIPWYFL